ncbi:helix-turn-helix domain-containing protein [Naasia sp. SYSU D00948]|uniref:ATP-binding protein n=1 Tax=Naasia sp. SYSU D00948 TaxID=2817379 RepID=UPI001B317456|nr:helix-turn-helix domain-containing protein [Naasia sp. SYSU D00948]
MSFGARLRSLRQSRGLTQEELAERAGMTANGVSALERGTRTRPYPHTLRSLADALGLDEAERRSFVAAAREDGEQPARAEPAAPGRSRLPIPPTPLVGRDGELDQLTALLTTGDARLITLTGPGGVGKTRLAAEVARRGETLFPDGVTAVALASLPDADLVAPTVLSSLGGSPGGSGRDLGARIGSRAMLLVLDNFEHVMDAAPLVAELAAECPSLTILVTSRARLRLRGEVEVPVRPLQLPASTRSPSPDEVSESPAGKLFLQRARAVQPGFALSPATAADIASITWRLGGLPLAIECAASKVPAFPPRQLLANLDAALATGWARDLPERQRSLRAVLDWSYQLLDEPTQATFRGLSVFQGGATLEEAEAVLTPVVGRGRVLAGMEELTEHSLLTVVTEGGDAPRYTMLQPVQQYARDLLREHDEETVAGLEHARFALHVLEHNPPVPGDRADWETENVRAAFDWCLRTGDGQLAARLAYAAWVPWLPWWLGAPAESGRGRLESLLSLDLGEENRSRALLIHGSMCYAEHDFGGAGESWQEALRIARARGDQVTEAYALAGTGLVLAPTDARGAADVIRQAIELSRTAEDDRLPFMASIWAGIAASAAGERAQPVFEEVLAVARRHGDPAMLSAALFNLGHAAIEEGNPADAETPLLESIQISALNRDNVNLAHALDLLAVIECQRAGWRRSALLSGAAEGARSSALAADASYHQPDPAMREQTRSRVEAALGPEAYAEAYAEGANLALDDLKRLLAEH